MTDFIATHSPLPVLANEDRTYIQDNFYTLEELCLGRTGTPAEYRSEIREGLLPRPAYVVDGIEMYPADFFLFPDSVGSLGARMKEEFSARYVRAAKVYGDSPSEDRIASEYTSYLSGEYAVCLRFLSPETIFLKEFAIAKIQELLATPNPSDADWSAALRNWVTRLDGIEREFAPCDTARFGSLPSRVRYIKNVREKFPSCFLTTEK
ncbi:MAG: hypothetical protein QOH31_1602 [Verrucomicrobiota bacterium]|jgi:hypothetical protein